MRREEIQRRIDRTIVGIALVACLLCVGACATAPAPDPDAAIVWGQVRLVPKQNAPMGGAGYGDRRLADVKRFDYSQLRFAVVFVPDAPPRNDAPHVLTIRDSSRGPRLEPAFGATTALRGISIQNETGEEQVVSAPDASWVRRIAPGDSAQVEGLVEGELALHLLGASSRHVPETVLVWVAQGLVAEVDADGRYVIEGLTPGRHGLRAWHPRLPPTPTLELELASGDVERVDLEIGVDVGLSHSGDER